jgi:dephospho-CoA kinase
MGVVILIGASGSGKTTIAQTVATRLPHVTVRFFDAIGVPPTDIMVRDHGSPEGWQAWATEVWMKELAALAASNPYVLFEGQTRLSFLAGAANGLAYTPILVDCDDETRRRRLETRGQAELADDSMMGWARWLRDEAIAAQVEIFDTSDLGIEDAAKEVTGRLNLIW